MAEYSNAELEAYLDESLPAEKAAAIEQALQNNPQLAEQLTEINGRRDAGVHSLGEVWRRNRLSCASREQLGGYLLGILAPEEADYISFHLETIGCRYCLANADDLRAEQAADAEEDRLAPKAEVFSE